MDDLDRTFDRLRRIDIDTLENLLWNQYNHSKTSIWAIRYDLSGKKHEIMNSEYLKILKDNGWTLAEFKAAL